MWSCLTSAPLGHESCLKDGGSGPIWDGLCSLLLMLQATILDRLFFDLFPFSDNVFVSSEVDIRWCDVAQTLVVTMVIVILDECLDRSVFSSIRYRESWDCFRPFCIPIPSTSSYAVVQFLKSM